MQDMRSRQGPERKKPKPNRSRLRSRTRTLRQQLTRLDFVLTGTLHHRTKACGKPNCACATDPSKRHGPYYEWGRKRNGKLVQHTVTPTQAKLIERGIANYQRLKEHLAQWEQHSEQEILKPEPNED